MGIGVLDSATNKGGVYYQAPGLKDAEFEEGDIKFKAMSEKDMLDQFWKIAIRYEDFVSFNGRQFDVPFLMVRSAIHQIRPSKNLLANRYLQYQPDSAKHYDLQDLMTFYGALRKKGGLHLWSRAFGIESPKADGVTGDDVARLFKEKKYEDIARYNVRDLRSTKELYEYWDKYLNF